MRLVTSSADFAPYCKDKSVAAPLRYIKDTGFCHIDLSMYSVIYEGSPWIASGDEWKRQIEDCARIAAELGYDFCQAHSPSGSFFKGKQARENSIMATRRSIEACAMLGIPHTVVHAEQLGISMIAKTFGKKKFFEKNKELFCLLADDMERYGVDVLVENSSDLWNPTYYLNSGREIREFVEYCGIPRLHVCWDTGHGNCQRASDQYKHITAVGKELKAFHLNDNFGNGDSHIMPMAGTVNWDQVLRGMRDIDYKGDFTFEGHNTLRTSSVWPNYRNAIKDEDILKDPPVYLQQKQISVMYEIGKWMLTTYGFSVE